jgi:hypothetical protein
MGNSLPVMESSPGSPAVRVVAIDYDPNAVLCTSTVPPDPPCCIGFDSDADGIGDSPACTADDNEGVEMRNGFGGELRNSIVINMGSEEGLDIAPPGSPVFWDVDDNICQDYDGEAGPNGDSDNGDIIRVVATTFADSGGFTAWPNTSPVGSAPCGTADIENQALPCGTADIENQALENGDVLTGATATGAGNLVDPDLSGLPWFGLKDEDTSFDPRALATGGVLMSTLKATPLNPRPTIAGPGAVSGIAPPRHALVDRSATYRGAFQSADTTLWVDDWTVLEISGLLD